MRESRLQLSVLALAALFYPITERWLCPWSLRADFPFLLLFAIALRGRPATAALAGFGLGLLRDLADFAQLGGTALAFSVVAYAIASLRDKIDRENLGVRLLLLMAAYLLAQAIQQPLRAGGDLTAASMIWLRYSLPGAPLNVAIYVVVLLVAHLIQEGTARLDDPLARR